MKRKAISAALAAVMTLGMFAVPSFAAEEKLLAFPDVEGGGKYTVGARGADAVEVYHVTNLNDEGEGSLRDAVSKSGRIVVFDVSGIIELKSKLTFDAPYVTVLGQTAPGDGITITGYDAEVKADNIILRYLRIRPTDSSGGEPDGLGGRWVHNVVLDHCSVSWGVDEMLTLYAGSLEKEGQEVSKDITVQYCLSSESLRMSSHIKGAHGYGGIIGGTNATYHHNLFAHHDSRNPRFDRNLQGTDMVNNVIYDWGNNSAYGAEPYSYNKMEQYSTPEYVSKINIRNNYYKYGPSTREAYRSKIFEATNDGTVTYNGELLKSDAYIWGNYIWGNTEFTTDNTISEDCILGRDLLNLLDQPINMGEYEINIETPEAAFNTVMDNVGATLPRRDSIDARVVADVKNGTGRIINQEEEVGGLTGIESETRIFEIPADWKSAHNMGDAADADKAPSGYTWIEEYVNDWTAQQSKPTNPVITVESPAIATTDQTVDKTDGKGLWTISSGRVSLGLSVKPVGDTRITKVEIYDGEQLIKTYDDTLPISKINDQIYIQEPGTHYITSKAYNDKGEKTTSDTAIVYIVNSNENQVFNIGKVPYDNGCLPDASKWTDDGITYIAGSGRIAGKTDSFTYDIGYTDGDFSYSAKIEEIPKFENGALNGIMFRESLDEDSRFIMISDTWRKYGENILVAARTEKGGDAEIYWFKDKEGQELKNGGSYDTEKYPLPKYMKLERTGDKLILSVSDDGVDYTNNSRQPMEFDITGWEKEAFAGLAVDSVNGNFNEANPMLPWFTIAGFSDIRMNGIDTELYKPSYDKASGLVSIDTKIPDSEFTILKANIVYVSYDDKNRVIGARIEKDVEIDEHMHDNKLEFEAELPAGAADMKVYLFSPVVW